MVPIEMENNVGSGNSKNLFLLNLIRWYNHLDPLVRKTKWSVEEEEAFIEGHQIHGNKWANIAKMIPGR